MIKRVLFCLLPFVGAAPCPAEDPAGEGVPVAVRVVLARQQARWNAGDLEGFLQDYWKSPKLTFSSGGETRRGFRETRERYLKTYGSGEQMGRLGFSELETTPLGDEAAMTIGRWRLTRAGVDGGEEILAGNFTLILRRIDGRWVIVHDHTSRSPAAAVQENEPRESE